MIYGTVALPIWNSKKIAWLCMESLCRQIKPVNGWELIVFEEMHSGQVGEVFIRSYENRLKEVGCENIIYLTSKERHALSCKWVTIAQASAATSRYYCMCGADDYYHSHLLVEAEAAIKEADWCLTTQGYFYDFKMNKVIQYNYSSLIGLHMIANTSMVCQFPMDEVFRGVDGWFSTQMINLCKPGQLRCMIFGSDHWKRILCTNGLNNISIGRINFFKDPHHPFYETDTKLENIVPEDICKRLKELSLSMQVNDDYAHY